MHAYIGFEFRFKSRVKISYIYFTSIVPYDDVIDNRKPSEDH